MRVMMSDDNHMFVETEKRKEKYETGRQLSQSDTQSSSHFIHSRIQVSDLRSKCLLNTDSESTEILNLVKKRIQNYLNQVDCF